MKKLSLIATTVIAAISLCGCGKLSKEAKEIVGTYYNTEVSQTEPVMRLKKDATCEITAIKPDVLQYSVDGKWNVENDTLIIILSPESLRFEGDSTLIGLIPQQIKRRVVEHSDFSLLLEHDNVTYLYQRRNE